MYNEYLEELLNHAKSVKFTRYLRLEEMLKDIYDIVKTIENYKPIKEFIDEENSKKLGDEYSLAIKIEHREDIVRAMIKTLYKCFNTYSNVPSNLKLRLSYGKEFIDYCERQEELKTLEIRKKLGVL